MKHPHEKHEEWLRKKKYWADKKRRQNNENEDTNSNSVPNGSASDPKLVPSEKLKQSLMTSHVMIEF